MIAVMKELTIGMDGCQNLVLSIPGDYREEYQRLHGQTIDVTIEQRRAKRSLNANALMWTLCGGIARRMETPHTAEDVYRRAVRDVGRYEFVMVQEHAVDAFLSAWAGNGIGWFGEVMDGSSTQMGWELVRVYYGSSTYTTDEMSRMLDYLMEDAMELNVTLIASRAQIEESLRRWGSRKGKQ